MTASSTVPRFSIVVPCHNVRAWLRPCLDSVLGQSFTDFEIIGVDGASTDGSGRILDEYAAADHRIRALHLTEDVGVGPTRNAGLKECRGDYVLFLDADDLYLPGSLEALADRIDATDRPDIVMFDYERIFWDGRVVRNQRHDAFARDGEGVFTAAERPVFLTFLEVVWNKACRRDFLTLHGFLFTAGYYEDAPWTYSTMLTAERIATLDRVVVHYRQHRTGGNIHGTRSGKHFDIFDQYDRVHAFITSDPELAGWRRFAFDRSLDHVLAVLARPERIGPETRAEFFHTAHAFAKRWKPEGYTADRTGRGFKRWMLIHDDYATYSTLKLSSKMLQVGNPRKAVGKLLNRADLDPNLALYCAYWFKQYACNPRAIYEKAAELAPQLRGVWVIDADHVAAIPEGVEYVVAGSPAYERLVQRATYFVSNMNLPKELEKREGQVHIQTQHGTPLKTMGTDLRHFPVAAKDLDLDELMRQADRWDFNISSNRYSSEIWERTYPAHFEELQYGFPRNDRLLTATVDEVRAIRAGFGFDDSHLVVFYAPTWRDATDAIRTPTGLIDLGGTGVHLDLDRLASAVGDHGRVLVRTHYSLAKGAPDHGSDRVIDVSDHPRVEDLMLAADVLISDYSSITFDYANLDRPIMLLVDDKGSYDDTRGTYFDITEFPPGLVARSAEELFAALQTGRFASAEAAKHRQLFREKFCEFDDGHAAERVVRRVFLDETELPPIVPPSERRPAPSPHQL
ncbi:CDP-glycerol glycerophosphotransferase (TagB/SpsB family) [Kribbella sp. VKM Ac-2527]|uniref:CDP-glycerol glycerophosphotransferase (TagB/SpsB family) n=1 Tax=Kribbella caucasensis TaxID=2512215 RepID=A0A4R6KK42_9ACTN|nr:bifunctional glycosyltransferase/CDP-glycerol:glycerophosphate glycerophosphotransferase [Kribbella sp. VKM Ac-2527]TDO50862.1 CDP-glycerol glycerophosphotransferase (TagB/SpsB family) [Kribbella sp. VKM Ac-2527]